MYKQKIILVITLLFLFGCSDKNPHRGLYNALFTDYDKRLATLEQNLTNIKNGELELKEKEHEINQNVSEKETILNLYREMDEVSLDLNSVDVSDEDRIKVDKIKKIIHRMKKTTIKNYH